MMTDSNWTNAASSNLEATDADMLAKEQAEQAVQQAREVSLKTLHSISQLDRLTQVYLAALGLVLVTTLIFDMASFSVGVNYAVSETTAQAQREAEATLNSWAYSAFSSSTWGKSMWLAAAGGIGTVIYPVVTKTVAAWVPLAQIGLAVLATLLMLLLFLVGFPDLSAYSDASCSATLLGYWLPLFCSAVAAGCSTYRLLGV